MRYLVVDDDDIYRERLMRSLSRRGVQVDGAHDVTEAASLASQYRFDRAIIDLRMPKADGLVGLTRLLKLQPELEALLVTGWGSITTAVEAVKLGAVNYISKPATVDDILSAFDRGKKTSDDTDTSADESNYVSTSLARVEWEHIQRVLRECGHNISETARRLKIPRRTLQRKLQKHPPPM